MANTKQRPPSGKPPVASRVLCIVAFDVPPPEPSQNTTIFTTSLTYCTSTCTIVIVSLTSWLSLQYLFLFLNFIFILFFFFVIMEPNCDRYSQEGRAEGDLMARGSLQIGKQKGRRRGVKERKEEWGSMDARIPDQTVLSSPLRVLWVPPEGTWERGARAGVSSEEGEGEGTEETTVV